MTVAAILDRIVWALAPRRALRRATARQRLGRTDPFTGQHRRTKTMPHEAPLFIPANGSHAAITEALGRAQAAYVPAQEAARRASQKLDEVKRDGGAYSWRDAQDALLQAQAHFRRVHEDVARLRKQQYDVFHEGQDRAKAAAKQQAAAEERRLVAARAELDRQVLRGMIG